MLLLIQIGFQFSNIRNMINRLKLVSKLFMEKLHIYPSQVNNFHMYPSTLSLAIYIPPKLKNLHIHHYN